MSWQYRLGRTARRRGMAAVMAMLFLVILATLSVAMFSLAASNVQSAANLGNAERARAAAESGLRWMTWRFTHMSRPKTTVGNITPTVAANLWPQIVTSITNDLKTMTNTGERAVTYSNSVLTTSPISLDGSGATFTIRIEQLPYYITDPTDSRYRHSIKVTATGNHEGASRSISLIYRLDKKVKFAVAGKVPIQLGRNVLVEGSVAMTTTAQPSGQPPVLAMSDFRNLTTGLTDKIDAFRGFLKNNYSGYDNRIGNTNAALFAAAVTAGFTDASGDGYIDEYDLFLKEFDQTGSAAVTAMEFTNPSTGKPYDDGLLTVIDSLGAPLHAGDATRVGYQDSTVDNNDAYAKVRGQILVAETANSLANRLASSGKAIADVIQGPIISSDPTTPPVRFGASAAEMVDLSPTNFDTSGFAAKAGPANGASSKTMNAPGGPASVMTNSTVTAADANGYLDNGVVKKTKTGEQTPYGSSSYQAKYDRPVFTNVTFKNCVIAKGTNALFDNCKFEGVTFVDMTTNITNSSAQTTTNKDDGMTWSKRMKSGKGSFSASTPLNATNSKGFTDGNNLRFNDCTFNGPLISTTPTAYTHFTNSWEFTGKTYFDNQADETATIVAPQVNIEMGSFTDPTKAPSTLKGVVVVGNIDIRGSGTVDGSILVTGDGAGNTTLGWFGASDGSTDTTAPMPEGGFGRLNLRYNPYRSLPDGINIAVDISPDSTTYSEK